MKARLRKRSWRELVLSRGDGEQFGMLGYMEDDDKLIEVKIHGMDQDEAMEVARLLVTFAETGVLRVEK